MKFAYADPPYLGQCGTKYNHEHHGGGCWDDVGTHKELIMRLDREYPDGWALSLSTPSLRHLLPWCDIDVRVCAWVKPFASFKPNVQRAYCWEPVLVRGGRELTREDMTVRDYCSANITMRRGFPGAKPVDFCFWLFEFLGMEPTDTLDDLFVGSGAVTRALDAWRAQTQLAL